MLTRDEYSKILQLKNDNPEIYNIFNKLHVSMINELSTINHTVKNQIAYLKSSYQLANDTHPEFEQIHNWVAMGCAINEMDYYMERLSMFRYSLKKLPHTIIEINELLYDMPDYVDNIIETDCDYSYDLCKCNPTANCNPDQLKLALSELIINATEEADIVYISSTADDDYVTVSIKNETGTPLTETDIDTLCEAHFTTKEKHTGLGLSIVHQVCLTYDIKLSVSCDNGFTSFNLTLPILKN
ncbi:MAG: ATP-binding protein [Lachnospira sp.]